MKRLRIIKSADDEIIDITQLLDRVSLFSSRIITSYKLGKNPINDYNIESTNELFTDILLAIEELSRLVATERDSVTYLTERLNESQEAVDYLVDELENRDLDRHEGVSSEPFDVEKFRRELSVYRPLVLDEDDGSIGESEEGKEG